MYDFMVRKSKDRVYDKWKYKLLKSTKMLLGVEWKGNETIPT